MELQEQEHSEQNTSLKNAKNNHNKDYLAENIQLEDTPFVLRRREQGWFITIGDTRITEPTETREETVERLDKEQWKIIAAMIVHVVKLLTETKIETTHKNSSMKLSKKKK